MSTIRFTHLADRLFGQPLMLHPGKLRTIVAVVAPRMGLPAMDWGGPDEMPEEQPETSAAGPGIAVIPIHGTVVHRATGIGAMSGLRSYTDIGAEFDAAMADGNVSGIVLHIDSGGGESSGAFDLADRIFGARGTKPIISVASERAYSAAYLLASAADSVILPRTGGVGSIGVVCVHCDISAADQQMGMSYTPVYAGAKKIDGWPHAALTDRAQAEVQAEVDRVYGMFCDTVARNRGVTVASIRATEAGCLYGQDAVTAGLADRIGLFADAVRTILPQQSRRQAMPTNATATKEMLPMAMDEQSGDRPGETENQPDVVEQPAPAPTPEPAPAPAQPAEPPAAAAAVDEAAIRADGYNAGHAAGSVAGYQAAMARVAEVMDLCAIARRPDMAAGFISADTSVADVRKALLAARADEVDETRIDSHAPASGGAKALEQLNAAADQLRQSSPKLSKAQAFTKACSANPALYQAYRAETRN